MMRNKTYTRTNTNIKVRFLMRVYNVIANLKREYPASYIRTKSGSGYSLGQCVYALECLVYLGIITKRKTQGNEYYIDTGGRKRNIGYTIVYGLKK
jgi:hypothetical protein